MHTECRLNAFLGFNVTAFQQFRAVTRAVLRGGGGDPVLVIQFTVLNKDFAKQFLEKI